MACGQWKYREDHGIRMTSHLTKAVAMERNIVLCADIVNLNRPQAHLSMLDHCIETLRLEAASVQPGHEQGFKSENGVTYDKKVDFPHSASPSNRMVTSGGSAISQFHFSSRKKRRHEMPH
jgi:hypothetical protein